MITEEIRERRNEGEREIKWEKDKEGRGTERWR